jgi:DNA-binding transcriptional LysR family regulator
MIKETTNLKQLLPHGAITAIAKKLGIRQPSVSEALRRGRPSHPAVQEALKIAKESGGLEAQQTLNSLKAA